MLLVRHFVQLAGHLHVAPRFGAVQATGRLPGLIVNTKLMCEFFFQIALFINPSRFTPILLVGIGMFVVSKKCCFWPRVLFHPVCLAVFVTGPRRRPSCWGT